jgi:DNA-binding transcriptional LysR family regulator
LSPVEGTVWPVGAPETDIDLLALDLARRVARLGSVARAAEELDIPAATANARLRNLEHQLGVSLLDRTPTGSRPTEVGRLVVEWAGDVLESTERLVAGVGALVADTRRLRIAASHTVAEHLLPAWLAGFRRRHPDVAPELAVTNSTDALERVRDGEALVGFIEHHSPPRDLASLPITADDLVVVVGPSHPWALDGGTRTVADLLAQSLVVREHDSATREVLDDALGRAGARLVDSIVERPSSGAVRDAAVDDGSPAVLSRLAVTGDLAAGRLHEVTIEGLDLSRCIRAVWLRRRSQPEIVTDLLDQVVRGRGTRQDVPTA